MLVSPSACLQCVVLVSSLLTFTGALTSGLMLLLAPEEPGWDIGGGVSFILYPGIAMLVLALLTILVAVLGCLSISCDSKTGLYSYAVISAFLACMGVASVSALVTFIYTDLIRDNINSTLSADIMNCNDSTAQIIFNIQSKYKCCGADSAMDWWQECPLLYNSTNQLLPESCCDLTQGEDVTCTNSTATLYVEGCSSALFHLLVYVVDISSGWIFIGALVQFFAAIVACYGGHLIGKYDEYDIL